MQSQRSRPLVVDDDADDQPLVDPGRSLALRLLALVGAFSFVMLGLASVVVPLLQAPPPPPMPDQRSRPTA